MSGHRHIRAALFLALACAIEAAAQSTAYGQSEAAWSEQVLALENEARISTGSQPLSLSPQLTAAAEQHSQSMAASGYFGHTGPDGSTPGSRILAAGYSGATAYGENIAAGFPDPQSVVQAWLASPGHRANILNPGYTQAGIGIAWTPGSAYSTYWTEDFVAGQGSMASPGTGYGVPPAPQPALQPAAGGVGGQGLAIAQPVAPVTPASPSIAQPASPVTPAGPSIAQPLAPVTSAGPSIAAVGASAPAIDQPASTLALYGSGFGSQPGWVLAGRRLLPVDYWSDQLVLVQAVPGISGWTGIAVVRPDERASNTVYVEIGY